MINWNAPHPHNLLNHLDEGVLLVDTRERVIFINRYAKRAFGLKQRKNHHGSLSSLLESSNPGFYRFLSQSIKDNRFVSHHEMTFIQKKERELKLMITLLPPAPGNGGKPHFSIIIKDITEIWKLHLKEKRLIYQIKNRYIDQMETLRQIADSVAHEVRNPIVSIGGYANLLLRKCALKDGRDLEELKKYITYIKEDAERLNHIVNQVERYSDISDIKFQRENTVTVFQEIFRYAKKISQKEKITLETPPIELEEYPIYIDRSKFSTAIKNLLRHSLLLSLPDRPVVISLRFAPYEISLKIELTTNKLKEEDVHFIFNPFYSLSTQNVDFDLAIAQRLIILHGGIIQTNMDNKNRLLFRISIPKEKRLSR